MLIGAVYLLLVVWLPVNVLQGSKVDLEKERATLLELHQTDRRAHFETNPNLLLKQAADDFISVTVGRLVAQLARK